MRAALGFDRSYTNSQMGTEMTNTVATWTTTAWITPSAKVASGTEWTEYRCANWWKCGSSESHAVIIDSYDEESEMHMCKRCHEYEVSNYGERVKTVRTRIRVRPVKVTTVTPKPHGIRFCADQFNNVRRMCTVFGQADGKRVWKVRSAMRDERGNRFYLVMNVETREFLTIASNMMTNLY